MVPVTGYTSDLHNRELLVATRRRLGLTQHQLSKRSGVSRSILASIESGRTQLKGKNCSSLWLALADAEIARQGESALPRLSSFGIPSSGLNPYFADSPEKLSDHGSVYEVIRAQALRIGELEEEVRDLRNLFRAAELEALSSARVKELDAKLSDAEEDDENEC